MTRFVNKTNEDSFELSDRAEEENENFKSKKLTLTLDPQKRKMSRF